MDVGQIGYHDRSKQRRLRIEKDRGIVRALDKTKRWEEPDLAALQQERADQELRKAKEARKALVLSEKEKKKKMQEDADQRSYKTLFDTPEFESQKPEASIDQSAAEEFEDDFM